MLPITYEQGSYFLGSICKIFRHIIYSPENEFRQLALKCITITCNDVSLRVMTYSASVFSTAKCYVLSGTDPRTPCGTPGSCEFDSTRNTTILAKWYIWKHESTTYLAKVTTPLPALRVDFRAPHSADLPDAGRVRARTHPLHELWRALLDIPMGQTKPREADRPRTAPASPTLTVPRTARHTGQGSL